MTRTRSSATATTHTSSPGTCTTRSSKKSGARADQAQEAARKPAKASGPKKCGRKGANSAPTQPNENTGAVSSTLNSGSSLIESRFRDEDIDPRLRNMDPVSHPQPAQNHGTRPAGTISGTQGQNDDSNLRDPASQSMTGVHAAQSTLANKGKEKEEDEDEDSDMDHGFIQGIMQGNSTLTLPEPIKFSKDASKHFRRLIVEIIARAEALAMQTGCWIYVAGQHPNASKPFTHYASPRLRAEGQAGLEKIKRGSEKEAALISAQEAEDRLASKERELREKDEIIASLRARHTV
ncbi:hypothetical protein NP233_g10941 [Leucocoprinus birnbaumii]|uniref:Uncharacterized protein n=1 Tax=Leucocoprinus birnbaumii TaxID=56174 RepID=A0AAD5VHS9_9AGAR|nr:hypothetical protein NP233_g10941 [Leucocoprinus birnbaumii]